MCADEGVGVAVLKVGASALGAAAAAAHTGAVAGDHRVFRALVEEAGAAWARRRARAARAGEGARRPRRAPARRRPRHPHVLGRRLRARRRRGGEARPRPAAVVAGHGRRAAGAAAGRRDGRQPARLHGDDLGRARDAARPRADGRRGPRHRPRARLLRPPARDRRHAAESWDAVEDGILAGAAVSPVPVMVAATLPELLDDEAAWRFCSAGVPAIAGLRTGVAVAAALAAPPGDAGRLREIAAWASRRVGGRWLAEHEAKALLRSRGVPVVRGLLALNEDDAVAAFRELGVARGGEGLERRIAATRPRSAASPSTCGTRPASARPSDGLGSSGARIASPDDPRSRRSSSKRWPSRGDELFVAVRCDAVVPVLVIGRAASTSRPRRRRRHPAAGTRPPAPHLEAIVHAADGLALLECNPVIGDVVVDATAQEVAT